MQTDQENEPHEQNMKHTTPVPVVKQKTESGYYSLR